MRSAAAIVNWNSGGHLLRCLESLQGQRETVVVDNASIDDSIERVSHLRDRARFIRNSDNRGFAAGVNQCFAETTSPYVLVLNPDVQATSEAIHRLEDFLDSHPRAGAVGGHINEQYLPRRLATPWTLICENVGLSAPPAATNDTEVEQAAAAALMIRRDAYNQVGGFDERFVPAWYEDVDFCKRLRAAGWQVHFAPTARFQHKGGYSAEVLGPTAFVAAYYRNQLRYVNKHFGRVAGAAVRSSIIAGMFGRMIAGPHKAGAYSKVIAGALGGW